MAEEEFERSQTNCRAKTKAGSECKIPAGDSGYCHIHDPERVSLRNMRQQPRHTYQDDIRTSFSEKYGFRPVREALQLDDIDDKLRSSLWNVLVRRVFDYFDPPDSFDLPPHSPDRITRFLWEHFFQLPIDSIPVRKVERRAALRKKFYNLQWFEVYDFVELILNLEADDDLTDEINDVLKRQLAGYRFIGGSIVPITDPLEVEAIETAIADDSYYGVRQHLGRALELLSDQQEPDYRNSIKESISAVESLVQVITGDHNAALGEAIKVLERSGRIHGALKNALTSLYGYTSQEDGVRHALLKQPNITVDDAKFFLVICSAFVNYLKAKV